MDKPNLPIGGFFPEEITAVKENEFHKNALCLQSGRACLNLLLEYLKPQKVYLPYYHCEVLLEPLKLKSISYAFYSIDENLEIRALPKLQNGELLLVINYFGLKGTYLEALEKLYKNNLIIDNTQAFFEKWQSAYSFNSARKFFGVSDGAYLYAEKFLAGNQKIKVNEAVSNRHLLELKKGNREVAFKLYREAERAIDSTIKKVSTYSQKILKGIDYNNAIKRRIDNYVFLHNHLVELNVLDTNPNQLKSAPFCYPFLPKKQISRARLIDKLIYFPLLWPNVIEKEDGRFEFEQKLAKDMFPLPIDQRWSRSEMIYIVNTINSVL